MFVCLVVVLHAVAMTCMMMILPFNCSCNGNVTAASYSPSAFPDMANRFYRRLLHRLPLFQVSAPKAD